MTRFGFFFFLLFYTIAFKSIGQSNSVLATGAWYKFGITENGVYQISGNDLANIGINISDIDPSKLRLYGTPGGMLPQANSASRPNDLEEMAVLMVDGGDGSFDTNDKIIFWAEDPDKIFYNESSQLFTYENNVFSDTSYYFLNINQSVGLRIKDAIPIEGSFQEVNTSLTYFIHEVDEYNILKSGRNWYGEKFDSDLDQTFETNLTNWISGSELKLLSSVMASSTLASSFTVFNGESTLGKHEVSPIPGSTYSIKGIEDNKVFTSTLPSSNGSPLEIKYSYKKQNGLGYLNFFLAQVEQNISLTNDFFEIFIPQQPTGISSLKSDVQTANVLLWNVKNINNVVNIKTQITNNNLSANIQTDTTSHLVLLTPANQFPVPSFVGQVANQNLHSITSVDLLIVTSPLFLEQANRLKAHKTERGINAVITITNQIFNEFSSGRKDVTALRDFAKYLYDNAGLKHLLLFGKGTYDYKNLDEKNNSFVPIYESRNSLSPLDTYGSDDYLGFMEEDEGEWIENLQGDHTIDIGVGRLPIKSIDDAISVVDKIIKYHSISTVGDWRKKINFVAENGDFNIHQRDAERLSTLIDTTYSLFNPQKIYIDAFPIETIPSGRRAPLVNTAIVEAIESGTLIMNYTGHGNENQWAKSNVFNRGMIEELDNKEIYPLIVTATCEFGRHDDANQISGGEELVVMPNAGAIGLITTSRPVFASSNYKLNLAFYSNVLATKNGRYKTLGEIFLETKNNSLSGPNNRNFSLLADPSLTLAFPKNFMQLDSLNDQSLQSKDTITALEYVQFTGSIRNADGTILTGYSGKITIDFYDRPTQKQTLGNFGNPFSYKDRDNLIFSGTSTITNGLFTFDFITPLDISYKIEQGKVSMYAIDTDSIDANGANVSIKIGGSAINPPADITPPIIELYLEDTTFKNNDLVSANSLLIVHLSDKSGINLSKSQVGHHITYSLDENEPISLNDYFTYNINSYQKGKIYIPLQNLSEGLHTILVNAWDTYNNPSYQEVTFKVASDEVVIISEVSVYPNPTTDKATFTFKHNLSGNDLEVTLKIINRSGQLIHTQETEYENSESVINNLVWDGTNNNGYKIIEGLYIYSITIRSISTGASNSFFGRLMTIN